MQRELRRVAQQLGRQRAAQHATPQLGRAASHDQVRRAARARGVQHGGHQVPARALLHVRAELHRKVQGRPRPRRLGFDLATVMRTQYRTDAFQENYFVVDRFEDVLRLLETADMPALWRELDALPDFMPEPALKAA